MKKFINGLLMLAIFAATMSGFVSCKDHDNGYDDLKAQINKEISLRQALEQQLAALKATLESLKTCQCNLEDYLKKSDAAATYQTKQDAAAAIQLLQDAINQINTTLGNIEGNYDDIASQLNTLNQLILDVKATADRALQLAENAKCDCDLEPLKNSISDLQGQIAGWSEQLQQVAQQAADALAKYRELEARVAANEAAIRALQNQTPGTVDLSNYVTKAELEAAKTAMENAYKAADNALKAEITAAYTAYVLQALTSYYDITTIDGMFGNYYNKTEIDNLLAQIKQCGCDLSQYYTKEEVRALIDAIQAGDVDLTNYYTKSDVYNKTEIDEKLTEINNKFTEISNQITEINNKFAQYVTVTTFETTLNNYYTKEVVDQKFETVNNTLTEIQNNITAINSRIDKLQDDLLKRMITGVIIQGTSNPIFGMIELPADMRSTLLATFYGSVKNNTHFPYAGAEDYFYYPQQYKALMANNTVKYYAIDEFVQKGTIINGFDADKGTGYLGKVYMTINPATADYKDSQPFEGLFDSQNNAAPVTIGTLQPSDKLVAFGMTRANDGSNGFYESEIRLNPADVEKVAIKIDYEALASDMKALLKNRTKSNALNLASTIVEHVRANNGMPAYAAKVNWTDETTGQDHNIYSQYNIGVTAMSPLAFNMFDNVSNYFTKNGKLLGFNRVENFLGRVIKEAKNAVHEIIKKSFSGFDFDQIKKDLNIHFQNIEISDIDALKTDGNGNYWLPVKVTTTVHFTGTAEGQTSPITLTTEEQMIEGNTYSFTVNVPVLDVTADVEGDAPVNYDGTVDMNWLKEFINEINARYGEGSPIDNALAALTNLLNELSNLETKIDGAIDDSIDGYYKRIQNFINRVNNRLVNYVEKIDIALHPTIVASKDNKYGLLSASKANPTWINGSGSITLFPTSYSLEILAPAYRKFLAVTNVYDADGNQVADYEAKARAANGTNMATIYSGHKKCTINGQAGYIYQVMYCAMDYHGKIFVKKYYVQFK